MKINSIGNGNKETKQHLLSLPNKSKKSIQITLKY